MRRHVAILWSSLAILATAGAVVRADVTLAEYAEHLDHATAQLRALYQSLAAVDARFTPEFIAQVQALCTQTPGDGACTALRDACAKGGAREKGAVGTTCKALGFPDDQARIPSPFTAAQDAEIQAACRSGEASSPVCVSWHAFCDLRVTYGYDLIAWSEDLCALPTQVNLVDHPGAISLENQPGPKALLGYLKFTGAKPASMTNAGGWGLGVDYRAMPTPIPFGGELDISKTNGSWHGRIGLHGGVGIEGERVSAGVLVGFRRGGLTHDGYDFPGEILVFSRLGPVALEIDGQAGYRLGKGVTNHFIAEGKLLAPLARARSQGGALFLGIDWATENGERFTSFVIGGGMH